MAADDSNATKKQCHEVVKELSPITRVGVLTVTATAISDHSTYRPAVRECGQFTSSVSQYNLLIGPRVSPSAAKIRPWSLGELCERHLAREKSFGAYEAVKA